MHSSEQFQLPAALRERLSTGALDGLPEAARNRIAAALHRLDETAGTMAGFFEPAEGAYLCDALRNADYPADRFDEWPLLLLWDLEDVETYEKLGSRRYAVDVPGLLEKMETLTQEQSLWVVAAVDRFWEERMRRGDSGEFFEVVL